MAGIGVTLSISGLTGPLTAMLHAAGSGLLEVAELKQALAEKMVDQVTRRIEVEKTAPDGTTWPLTRDGRGALFVTGGHLARSIQASIGAQAIEVGSGWIGARLHQLGGTIKPVKAKALFFRAGGKSIVAKKVTIPARPYLGFSEANLAVLKAIAEDALALALTGAAP